MNIIKAVISYPPSIHYNNANTVSANIVAYRKVHARGLISVSTKWHLKVTLYQAISSCFYNIIKLCLLQHEDKVIDDMLFSLKLALIKCVILTTSWLNNVLYGHWKRYLQPTYSRCIIGRGLMWWKLTLLKPFCSIFELWPNYLTIIW